MSITSPTAKVLALRLTVLVTFTGVLVPGPTLTVLVVPRVVAAGYWWISQRMPHVLLVLGFVHQLSMVAVPADIEVDVVKAGRQAVKAVVELDAVVPVGALATPSR